MNWDITMNERDAMPSETPRVSVSGGNHLRQLREERGLALEGLASMLKVAPGKLDALESGRYHELPDAAFTRALAMTICRLLKADPVLVMASLPQAQLVSLSASEPNQVPFKAKRARLNLDVPTALSWREFLALRWLVPAGVLLSAAGLYFLPQDWMAWRQGTAAEPASMAPAASAPASATVSAAATSASSVSLPASSAFMADAASMAMATSAPEAAALQPPMQTAYLAEPAGPTEGASVPGMVKASGSALVLNVSESSWVEVRDADGRRLLSRHVTPGETVGVDGVPPLSVRIGNVGGVSLKYRGQNVDLSSYARNNVARLELK